MVDVPSADTTSPPPPPPPPLTYTFTAVAPVPNVDGTVQGWLEPNVTA